MKPRCEAHTGTRWTDWGPEPMRCHQQTGLRILYDMHGEARYFCAAAGHLSNVLRRFGAAPDEISRDMAKVAR